MTKALEGMIPFQMAAFEQFYLPILENEIEFFHISLTFFKQESPTMCNNGIEVVGDFIQG